MYAAVGDAETYFTAVKYELFSQVAGLMVIGVGKAAVGMFLLRIVRNKIHIWVIWVCLFITAVLTLFASITVIVQCVPVQKSWNPSTPGHCWLNFSNVGYTVGSWFVAADFSFAILPWFVVWDLNMKQKEKITVACGLSLGVFAGVCGIVRTVALSGLDASEYIYDTVPMLIWSATESCVTIMCSTIPVLRPLYIRVRYGKDGKDGSSGDSSYKLPMYGSGGKYNSNRHYGQFSKSGLDSSVIEPKRFTDQMNAIQHTTSNTSDETILRGAAGIERTDEISSESSTLIYSQEPLEIFQNRMIELCQHLFNTSASEIFLERLKGGGFDRITGIVVKSNEESPSSIQYILRVPRFEIVELEYDLVPLKSLRQESNIPVPETVKFDLTSSNTLGRPHVLQKSLGKVFFELHSIRSTITDRLCWKSPEEQLMIQPFGDQEVAALLLYENGPATQSCFDLLRAILAPKIEKVTASNHDEVELREEPHLLDMASEMNDLGVLDESS
ncbi:hypothetical protein N7540_010833 [Penicillium herquei]|nr:hypothetical protein N7540_010833 [Penicillium herquei]